MNTPVQLKNENKNEYIDKLHAQLIQNQIRRTQTRDYGRILREYNTPAQWYKISPITRSIYFYDPHYQRYLQQQSKLLISSKTNVRSIPSSIRIQDRQKQINNNNNNLPSRLKSVPILPPIITLKKRNDE